MHLVSLSEQAVEVDGRTVRFAERETIHTEDSRKYEIAEFEALAASAGWRLAQTWTDPDRQFAVLGHS